MKRLDQEVERRPYPSPFGYTIQQSVWYGQYGGGLIRQCFRTLVTCILRLCPASRKASVLTVCILALHLIVMTESGGDDADDDGTMVMMMVMMMMMMMMQ